jgi:glycosyltransferase involved in cell wall biosynthesis
VHETRGVAVVTYNRADALGEILKAVERTTTPSTKLVVADDGSTDNTAEVVRSFPRWTLVQGSNKGVAANKNRGLWSLRDKHFIALIEDDLKPVAQGWFDMYMQVCIYSGIHHFCRVQDKRVNETIPAFTKDLLKHGLKPLYGPSPRGDFTFISRRVLDKVGGLNPAFKGVGYAHGEWSDRVYQAGLIPHPLKWVDLRQEDDRDHFVQIGDTEGGRWNQPKELIDSQIALNKKVRDQLKEEGKIFCPLVLE